MRFSPARLYIGVILAGQFIANVDTAIINVATPSIGATLHATGAALQLTVTVYILATAMLLVTAARLGTLYGYRRMFLIGLAAFTLASLGCGLAPDVLSLIGARIAQGAGAALMIAQVLSGIQRTLDGAARTRAIGAYTLTLSISAVIGQILGGALITANLFDLAWRPLFLINIPVGALLFALALRVMPHDERSGGPRPALDVAGVALHRRLRDGLAGVDDCSARCVHSGWCDVRRVAAVSRARAARSAAELRTLHAASDRAGHSRPSLRARAVLRAAVHARTLRAKRLA